MSGAEKSSRGLPCSEYRLLLPSGTKRPGREDSHLHPSIAEVKNTWSYTPTPPICLHNLHRDNFIFTEVSSRIRFPFFSSACKHGGLPLGERSSFHCLSHCLWNIKQQSDRHEHSPSAEWRDVTWLELEKELENMKDWRGNGIQFEKEYFTYKTQ